VGSAGVLMRFDVADAEAVNQAFRQIVADHGEIHILVNNAGVAVNALTLGAKDADWQRALAVNLGGAFNCTRAPCARSCTLRVAVGSSTSPRWSGRRARPGKDRTRRAKAGLLGLTKTWAREYASRGVTSNAVSPGFIETDMTAAGLLARAARPMCSSPFRWVVSELPRTWLRRWYTWPVRGPGMSQGRWLRVNGGLLM